MLTWLEFLLMRHSFSWINFCLRLSSNRGEGWHRKGRRLQESKPSTYRRNHPCVSTRLPWGSVLRLSHVSWKGRVSPEVRQLIFLMAFQNSLLPSLLHEMRKSLYQTQIYSFVGCIGIHSCNSHRSCVGDCRDICVYTWRESKHSLITFFLFPSLGNPLLLYLSSDKVDLVMQLLFMSEKIINVDTYFSSWENCGMSKKNPYCGSL